MKKSGFSDEQIVNILSSVTGGATVREVCQSHGVSENTFIESFHSTLRRDYLIVELFFNLLDTKLKTAIYNKYANQVRPNWSPGYKAPAKYATMKAGTLM